MPEQKAYSATVIFSWGLTASVGLLGICGIWAMFLPDPELNSKLYAGCIAGFAGISVFALAAGNCAASHAQQALSLKDIHWSTAIPAVFCALVFAGASVLGVHLGWSLMAEQAPAAVAAKLPGAMLVDFIAILVALSKPAMSWVREGRREVDVLRWEQAERNKRDRARARRLEDAEFQAKDLLPTVTQAMAPVIATAPQIVEEAPARVVELEYNQPKPEERKIGFFTVASVATLAAKEGLVELAPMPESVWQPRDQRKFDEVKHLFLVKGLNANQITTRTKFARTTVYAYVKAIEAEVRDGQPRISLVPPMDRDVSAKAA